MLLLVQFTIIHFNMHIGPDTLNICPMSPLYLYTIYGFFFSAGPSLGESEVKTEIAYSLSQLGLLCSTYILFKAQLMFTWIDWNLT